MKKGLRIFFAVWSLLFLLFAYWQWNDPDPLVWMGIYGYAALMCGLAASGRFWLPLLAAGVLLGVAGFVYMYPGGIGEWIRQEWQQQDLSMKTQQMEEAREAFGLLLVALLMGVAAWIGWRRQRGRRGVLHQDPSKG
ncbi:transmembrane 220 family protein [Cesiribacter andamanensis]|uniref:Transmembrane protein n=1 Tax=Cesiribacter andamanensis AMV16 TaxID=1279009 RepID=M7NLV1_9BACT|nr:transmembrane 220 family protein [Cesiribacter andamanensis]EMR02745.1 hypothetical protein ADICEAN_02114 [Cesiribacter andamanensis AMV16]